ncbi:MAG: HlyD family efflux transporter periplasmic adaptor subunit [Planctomycetota bacterium]
MSEVDLSALRMEEPKRPRRPIGARLAVIVVVAIGLGVVATFLVPILRPARAVSTAAVKTGGLGGTIRQMSAEAAGWIEPEPYAVVARPLVPGVLKTLDVLEGTEVKAGETVIGVVESAELLAARDRARALVAHHEGECAVAQAELDVAEALLSQKGDLRLADAEGRNRARAAEERFAVAKQAVVQAQAEREARRAELEAQEKLREAGGTYAVAIARARAALAAAEAAVAAREAEVREAEAEFAEARERGVIAAEVLADPRGLEGAAKKARAVVELQRANIASARTDVEIAERELAWATVKAPVDGVVMKLLAAPGQPVGPEGEGLVSIYDPRNLQARVDVPLASMAGVRAGQEVEIRSEVVGSRVTKGVVLRVQRESDLLKNTLQVKVKLVDPDPLLRPETLCRARFLAAPGEQAAAAPQLFLVPKEAVREGVVFVVDPTEGRARRIAVERVGEEGGDAVVQGDLSVTHRVILDPVEDGDRVKEQAQ